jgi:DNA-directed RNA polymerase specialized sigma24 family protein
MDLAALRRAFRARPASDECYEFASFLEGLGESELAWQSFVSILEMDVIPVVARHHPAADDDEITSTCLAGVFETWVSEWLDCVRGAELARKLLKEERADEAFATLAVHPRYHGQRAASAHRLWASRRPHDAVSLIEGTQSARNRFIARTRAQVNEAERKQRRRSILLAENCRELSGLPGSVGRQALATPAARLLCGAELEGTSGERAIWRISALPPAQLVSQDLANRLQRMLGAIEALGPDHARVFKLLLEGLSQRSIAKVEGRHPAAISRRVHNLRELCRMELLG